MLASLRTIYLVFVYRLSWVSFVIVGILFNIFVCAPLLILPRRERLSRQVRYQLQVLFKLWVKWMHMTGVAKIEFDGFDRPTVPGTIFVANHPSLLDATFLMARLPDTICILKPLLMKNPATGPAAVMAGFVSSANTVDLIREATGKLENGLCLLVFPEGTRTKPGESVGRIKAGFALIANRVQAPVQLILVQTSPDLARRGRSWWQPPRQLPATFKCSFDRVWLPDGNRSAHEFAKELEAYMYLKLEGTCV
jgi:1-acyl-sn-glycerol-3-phosphate acyltransferase